MAQNSGKFRDLYAAAERKEQGDKGKVEEKDGKNGKEGEEGEDDKDSKDSQDDDGSTPAGDGYSVDTNSHE